MIDNGGQSEANDVIWHSLADHWLERPAAPQWKEAIAADSLSTAHAIILQTWINDCDINWLILPATSNSSVLKQTSGRVRRPYENCASSSAGLLPSFDKCWPLPLLTYIYLCVFINSFGSAIIEIFATFLLFVRCDRCRYISRPKVLLQWSSSIRH